MLVTSHVKHKKTRGQAGCISLIPGVWFNIWVLTIKSIRYVHGSPILTGTSSDDLRSTISLNARWRLIQQFKRSVLVATRRGHQRRLAVWSCECRTRPIGAAWHHRQPRCFATSRERAPQEFLQCSTRRKLYSKGTGLIGLCLCFVTGG